MNIHPKFKPVIYGLGVFSVYAILTYVLRLVIKTVPTDAAFIGIYSKNDLFIGLAVAVVLTLSHERKKKLK